MPKSTRSRFQPALLGVVGRGSRRAGTSPATGAADDAGETWEAYRTWLSRVEAANPRRGPDDRSLYSWQGYQSWARRVRRAMESDS